MVVEEDGCLLKFDPTSVYFFRKTGEVYSIYDFASYLLQGYYTPEEFKQKVIPIGTIKSKEIKLPEGCPKHRPRLLIITSEKYGLLLQKVVWDCPDSCPLTTCINRCVAERYPRINNIPQLLEKLSNQ